MLLNDDDPHARHIRKTNKETKIVDCKKLCKVTLLLYSLGSRITFFTALWKLPGSVPSLSQEQKSEQNLFHHIPPSRK